MKKIIYRGKTHPQYDTFIGFPENTTILTTSKDYKGTFCSYNTTKLIDEQKEKRNKLVLCLSIGIGSGLFVAITNVATILIYKKYHVSGPETNPPLPPIISNNSNADNSRISENLMSQTLSNPLIYYS